MQVKSNTQFIKNFMVGLVASSVGALVALPSSAMPEAPAATPTGDATEVIPAAPTAEETLPVAEPSAEALELEAAPVAEEPLEETEAVAEEPLEETEAVAEEPLEETEAVAEESLEETEAVAAEEDVLEEEVAAEEDVLEEEVAAEEDVLEEEVAEEDVLEETEEVAEEETLEETTEEVVEDPAAVETEVVDEDMDTSEFTIAELTSSSQSFQILTAALEAADLTEILGGEGPYTVFAPTDEAFADLPEGAVDQLLLPENKDVLIQVLTYHVVPGAILSTELETGSVETVEGSEVEIEVADSVTVNNANVLVADVEASNGVIHIIDRVILPPTPEADAETEAETTAAAAE